MQIINQAQTGNPQSKQGRGRPRKHLERKHKAGIQSDGTEMETAGEKGPKADEKRVETSHH